ncbi:serine/arginine repetitive matrix protein 2-like isoform X15 [Perca fluviatilis]|uniref:serine/arginine repetitive matrix protein 2-like isoform X15 n=1 Tax=Perca fluviatilis TaxID=8168 RepID=UPI00196535AC|nr:serine/arginine repetitive matrix protein 2-like isoform X15 [Perca fluviatilis]
MLFVRAVWNENGKEMEGTIPDAWVNVAEKTLRWPKTRAKYCFDNHVAPKEDWETFPLLKVKITSESFHECEDYDQTSHAELCEEDEDEEVVVQKRMKKKKHFDDFVEGSDLSEATAEEDDKEKRKGDSSPIIPVFPTPPIKLKNVGVNRSNSGSPRSAGRDRSTGRTARSAGRDRSTSGSPRSAGRDRSTSRSPRSAGRDRTTSRTARSAGRDRTTSRSPRSAGRDRSTSRTPRSLDRSTSDSSRSRSVGRDSSISCSSRSVGRDNSSSRVHRSQAVEGLSHEMSSYNRDVPTTFPLSEAKSTLLLKCLAVTREP